MTKSQLQGIARAVRLARAETMRRDGSQSQFIVDETIDTVVRHISEAYELGLSIDEMTAFVARCETDGGA